MVTVMIVDDEALVRSGFALVLGVAAEIDVVAVAEGHDAVETIRRVQPEVVLLDLRMPDIGGLDVLAEVMTSPRPPAMCVLTTFDTDDDVVQALRLGAAGFLVKDTDPAGLAASVRTLAAGGVVLSPQVSRSLLAVTAPRDPVDAAGAASLTALTSRERDVLERLSLGESNAEIGARLHLSPSTVKDHVSAILAKLGVATRLEAALVAERARRHAGASR